MAKMAKKQAKKQAELKVSAITLACEALNDFDYNDTLHMVINETESEATLTDVTDFLRNKGNVLVKWITKELLQLKAGKCETTSYEVVKEMAYELMAVNEYLEVETQSHALVDHAEAYQPEMFY